MRLFKKRELTQFELEEKRIIEKLATLEIGTEEYDKVQSELEKHRQMEEKKKDSNRRLSKESKGKLLNTALSGVCLGSLAYGISRFELKGNLFTGENRGSINSIVKIASRVFFGV